MRGFRSLLSGVSVIAVISAFGAADPALAAQTISGPLTSPPVTNGQPDSVTINLDATIDKDATTNDSFFNGKAMSAVGANLTVNDSFLLGDIVNESSMVSSAGIAITILNDSQIGGELFNSGTIDGATIGISLADDSTIAQGIRNTGSIVGGATAILLGDDSEIFGGITNSGLISGAYGINIADAQAELHGGITNQAGGTIQGVSTAAIQFDGTILTGGITNDGLIQGRNAADGIVLNTGTVSGGITNNVGGIIEVTGTSATAILINGTNFVGNVTNSGQILGENTSSLAVVITGATVFTGNVANNAGGVISASSTALLIDNATFTGNVSNSGNITSLATDAVVISAPSFIGDFTNTTTGDIDGDDVGLYLNGAAFTGNLVNDGDITGHGAAAVFIGSTAFTGNVTNNGGLNAANGDGLTVDTGTTLTGNISNGADGEISAATYGIRIDGIVTGSITNAGLIDPSTGILVNGQVDGGITNSGTILADLNAINLAPANTATSITQTGGLIRGNNGAVTTALRLDQTGAEFVDTFHADGGTLDGDIVGGGTDDVDIGTSTTFAYLRGTTSGVDQFDMSGTGTALLGSNARGATGTTNAPGVAVNAASMTHGGEGTLYIDDDTTVALTGDYTQTDGTLEFQLTADTTPGTYGTIAAGGNVNLDGRIAAYIQGDSFASVGGNTFTYEDVITGNTSGTFTNAGTIDTNSLFFEGEAVVNANDVDIVLTRLSFMDALVLPGLTQNQTSIGGALDTIYDGGTYGSDFEDLFNHLLSLGAGQEEEAQHIYDELGGAEHADIQEIGMRASHAFNDAIGERMDDMKSQGGHSSTASLGLRRYAQASPNVANDGMSSSAGHRASDGYGSGGASVWGRGYGAWTESDGDAEAAGFDSDTGGFAGGVDFAVDRNWKVGGAIGWSSTDIEFATTGDEADLDSFQFAAYGAFETGRFYADALMSFGFHDITSTRLVELGFGTEIAGAAYDANSFGAHGEAGMVFDAGRIDIQPFVALGYTSNSTDGFSESGAGDFGLLVADASADSLASTLGLRFSGTWTAGGVRLIPDAEIAWRHEFMDERQSFTAAFLDDPSTQFQIVSSALARESVLANAGLGAQLTKGLVLFVDYNGTFNSSANTHVASAGFRASW